jgi:dihydroxyacetone kinase-like predicted kinase
MVHRLRFCTEFLVELPADTKVDEAMIKSTLSPLGDSIVPLIAPMPSGGKLLKTHIHSNNPAKVWAEAAALPGAKILKTKADDMLMQVAPHIDPPTQAELDGRSFYVVIYSTNGIASTSIATRHDFGFVAARVMVSGESYRDHLEISAKQVDSLQACIYDLFMHSRLVHAFTTCACIHDLCMHSRLVPFALCTWNPTTRCSINTGRTQT